MILPSGLQTGEHQTSEGQPQESEEALHVLQAHNKGVLVAPADKPGMADCRLYPEHPTPLHSGVCLRQNKNCGVFLNEGVSAFGLMGLGVGGLGVCFLVSGLQHRGPNHGRSRDPNLDPWQVKAAPCKEIHCVPWQL